MSYLATKVHGWNSCIGRSYCTCHQSSWVNSSIRRSYCTCHQSSWMNSSIRRSYCTCHQSSWFDNFENKGWGNKKFYALLYKMKIMKITWHLVTIGYNFYICNSYIVFFMSLKPMIKKWNLWLIRINIFFPSTSFFFLIWSLDWAKIVATNG
jgi:hypothetical protein